MPRVLSETEIDPIAEQVDLDMQEAGEEVGPPVHKFDPTQRQDLSDGGTLGGVRVVPVGESGRVNFKEREPGRPTTRAAWTWDGRPTELPLAWNPAGKQHDGARKYLLKRHCGVCNFAGFYGRSCPDCRKKGRPESLGAITPAYYLKFSQVPNPAHPFGDVDCIVASCVRRGQWGFHNEMEMRQHAASRHRSEYRAFQEVVAAGNKSQIDQLQQQVNALLAGRASGQQGSRSEEEKTKARARMAKVRAARKKPVAA